MSKINISNPHIKELAVDTYYHLGFDSSMDIKKMFGDVKFVIFGGSNDRMLKVAQAFADAFWPIPLGQSLKPIGSTVRYHCYKIGNVLTCSHQMGMASFSILLHEMAKLLAAAEATDVEFIRLGTSGGVGLPGGTIVVTDKPVNGYLEPEYELLSLGKLHKHPSVLCPKVSDGLFSAAEELGFPVARGNTMSVDCFYEGQGRLDGALCEYTENDKMEFLKYAQSKQVKNIEMESCVFGALCHRLNIPAAVICVTLLNRLEGDQVALDPTLYPQWIARTVEVVVSYVSKQLNLTRVDKQ